MGDDNGKPRMSDSATSSLRWLDDGTPFCERFGDTYFSQPNGRDETRAVFLSGNGLPERWAKAGTFVVAELGFGTGLNFFETLFQWRAHARADARLTYVSFEQFPVGANEMARALEPWPELLPVARNVLERWPPGACSISMDLGSVQLELIAGDARKSIAEWHGQAEAWYLDGFAPAKNPQMWNARLMEQVFAHTAPGGTFSTYTCAGWVRRNLEAAGFRVNKVPGFGRKRERLEGVKPNGHSSLPACDYK